MSSGMRNGSFLFALKPKVNIIKILKMFTCRFSVFKLLLATTEIRNNTGFWLGCCWLRWQKDYNSLMSHECLLRFRRILRPGALSPPVRSLSSKRKQSCVSNSCEGDLRPKLLYTESFLLWAKDEGLPQRKLPQVSHCTHCASYTHLKVIKAFKMEDYLK